MVIFRWFRFAPYLAPGTPQDKGAPCASGMMERPRIRRRLGALVHAVVADHRGDAKPIAGEHAAAAGGLALAVLLLVPPVLHRRLVTPERQRQQLCLVGQRLEPLDRDEAIH